MKPVFALDLAQDSVTLLRRAAEGWLRVGKVDLGAGTVEADLVALKARAEALEPDGFATKLILPPSQILYTTVEAPGGDRASRRAAIAEALEGQTPYAVEDLVFDFTHTGATTRVAVVARETLEEAEGFAETYGFRPICFVAVPERAAFAGEPFFGLTSVAGAHVAEGEKLDRDQDPVRVTGDDAGEAAPEVEEAAPVAESVDKAAPESEAEAVEAETAPEAEDAVAETAPAEPEEVAALTEEAETEAPVPDLPEPTAEAPVVKGTSVLTDTVPEPAEDEAPFIAVEDPEPPVATGPQSVLAAGLPDETADELPPPFQTRRAPAANWPDDEEDLRAAENRLHLVPDGPGPDAPVIRRIEGASAITAPDLAVPDTADLPADDGNAPTRRAGRLGRAMLDTIPDAAHGTQAQQKLRRAAEMPPLTAIPDPAPDAPPVATPVRNTTSAPGRAPAPPRAMAPAAPSKGRGRMLAMLTGGLVLLMLAVGFGGRLIGGGSDPAPATEIAAPATTPDAAAKAPVDVASPPSDMAMDEPDATAPPMDVVTADPAPLPAEVTATPTISATDAAIADALGEPIPDAEATGSTAEATAEPTEPAPEPGIAPPAAVAVTPPVASPEPQADSNGAPLIAQAPPGPDEATAPVALPEATGTAVDVPPARQPVPPPAGTVVEFGPDGLIVAKPEGVITPGGFTLYSGAPPVVPPLRPGTEDPAPATAPATGNDGAALPADPATGTAAAPPADPAAVATAPAPDPAVVGRRPASRPDRVLAAATAARQKADALADAAAAAAKAEAERLASATPQAVASSRRPAGRPSDFSAAVAAAVAAAVSTSVTTPPAAVAVAAAPAPAQPQEDIDEPEPVSTMPNLPTSVTVSKQATVKNAVDLGDITLIGVYGSSANRRALVRMPTGRFIKIKVGDRLDGGTVAAIGDNSVSYVKRGKTIVLALTKKG